MVALQSLVASARRLGIPPGLSLPITQQLLEAFVDAATTLESWEKQEGAAAIQAALDMTFLSIVKGEDMDSVASPFLAKVCFTDSMRRNMARADPAQAKDICPQEFRDQLPALALESLRRTQLLLHPLIAHLDPAKFGPSKPAATDARMASLLRFGAPATKGGVGTEFRSPIAVARPGKRFGLLSIAT
jgi:hypothetical protein